MSGNSKKDLVLCDYCQVGKDGNQIYTIRKQFAGCKIIDILQTVTHRVIPPSTQIKICSLCASTLHATTGAIAKAIDMVSKLTATGKKQQVDAVLMDEQENDSPEEAVAASPAAKQRKQKTAAVLNDSSTKSPAPKPKQPEIATPNKSLKKGIKDLNGTPTGVQQSPAKQSGKGKLGLTSTPAAAVAPATPNKLQVSEIHREDSLLDAIKVKPANDEVVKNKEFIQLFAAAAEDASESEEEEEDDEADRTEMKNIDTGFECKLCDFAATYPVTMKKHLREMHGQKRPRIFNCTRCSKVFGVVRSLRTHLLTHGIGTEKKPEDPAPDPQLAVLTALKPKSVQTAANNGEYTFAINDSNSSTPKPAAGESDPKFQCEICKANNFTAAKQLQNHLKTMHNIERPKAFKCDACDSYFMHKVTMDRHYKKKHLGEDDAAPKIKIKARRSTIAEERNIPELKAEKAETVSPAKIRARRKTVTIELSREDEPAAEIAKENGDVTVSPNKSILKASKAPDTPKKLKNPIEALKQSFSEIVASPVKIKAKSNDVQSPAPATPSKSKNDTQELICITPIQKDKSRNNTRNLDESTQIVGSPSKKAKAKKGNDTLDASHNVTTEVQNISTPINGSVKKSGKRKQREEESSQAEEADNESTPVALKQSKKSKTEIHRQTAVEIVDLLDEINPNVQPLKRKNLDAVELSDTEISCNLCDKVVGSRKRLDSHMSKKHSAKLTCPHCLVLYKTKAEYIEHFTTCKPVGGLPCGVKDCDKVFSDAPYLTSHLAKKHKSSK